MQVGFKLPLHQIYNTLMTIEKSLDQIEIQGIGGIYFTFR